MPHQIEQVLSIQDCVIFQVLVNSETLSALYHWTNNFPVGNRISYTNIDPHTEVHFRKSNFSSTEDFQLGFSFRQNSFLYVEVTYFLKGRLNNPIETVLHVLLFVSCSASEILLFLFSWRFLLISIRLLQWQVFFSRSFLLVKRARLLQWQVFFSKGL